MLEANTEAPTYMTRATQVVLDFDFEQNKTKTVVQIEGAFLGRKKTHFV